MREQPSYWDNGLGKVRTLSHQLRVNIGSLSEYCSPLSLIPFCFPYERKENKNHKPYSNYIILFVGIYALNDHAMVFT